MRTHEATCSCGFKTTVDVGGLRSCRDFLLFPFLCKSCGIVNLNVKEEPFSCPKCHSVDVAEYGVPPASLPSKKRYRNRKYEARVYRISDAVIQCLFVGEADHDFLARKDGNYCPACGEMTLSFSGIILYRS